MREMLKVALFAVLVINCKCIQPYSATAHYHYDNMNDNSFTPVPRCYPVDDSLTFNVNREKEGVLVFTPSGGSRFCCDEGIKENIKLKSIRFLFFTDKDPQVHVVLKSLDVKREWTVISRLFEAPELSADMNLALKKALFIHLMNQGFARELHEQKEKKRMRKINLRLIWVEELLTRDRPKLDSTTYDADIERSTYEGLPSVIASKTFNFLEGVERDMEIADGVQEG